MQIRWILASFSLGAALSAQVTRNHDVPLKNWAAPLYWQPSPAETEAARARLDPAIRPPKPEAATPVGSLVFVGMTPCRVVDTRASSGFPNPFGMPALMANATRSFPVQSSGNCTIPAVAQAYSFNVTVIPNPLGTGVGYLTIWPTAGPPNTPPTAVTLDDFPTGDIRNNAAIVPAGITNGSVSVITNGTNVDLVIDINGYFAPATGITLDQGTAAAPSLSFAGDAGTGIFSSGAGTLNFTTGGTNALTIQSNADLNLAGNVRKGGVVFLHNLGTANTGVGLAALGSNTTGSFNTASGLQALFSNTAGSNNTSFGSQALYSNTTGGNNTASGSGALGNNTTGSGNTASGNASLIANTSGNNNTASGDSSLFHNTTGGQNTAVGALALTTNIIGSGNTATGYGTLNQTTGSNNTATGSQTMQMNSTGSGNTATGQAALFHNTTGINNIAAGYQAGFNITGSNNIDIGHPGTSSDGGVIRIGTGGTQTSFFAAGVNGVMTGGAGTAVLVDSNGQLGTISSSRRFKKDIQDMDHASNGLLRLRPVTFRYQKAYADGSEPIDYGLIAEEVAEVYPDLVVKGAAGQIETVQYHKLVPMLLNELQKQEARIAVLEKALENSISGHVQAAVAPVP